MYSWNDEKFIEYSFYFNLVLNIGNFWKSKQ